ncbi:MAG: tRNA lysidine(34) synthetase TilS, partial [Clostridia bacterium]|nr:tRNA lysidine(34) synthetase TilS [Clostridia bacterium]
MICKVKQAIEKFGMPENCTVTVGLSGGADSVALLDVLIKLSGEYSWVVKAAHVNHCLRGVQADADESFVRSLCEKRGVQLSVLRADVAGEARRRHIGLEECGRQIRYDFFASLDTDYIATAHTLSDTVETMFINLSRGCSLSGLCSIPPVRGKIIRPLILCTGGEVRQYCKENGLDYVIDGSNNEDEYLRNRIRHYAVPEFIRLQPRFEENAGRCIDALRDDNDLLDMLTDELIKKATAFSLFLFSFYG